MSGIRAAGDTRLARKRLHGGLEGPDGQAEGLTGQEVQASAALGPLDPVKNT